jgi:hypothetical protein
MRGIFARLCLVGVMWIVGGVMLVPAAAQAGSGPSIAFTPSSHDYGTLSAGQTASQTLVLTNSGGGATGALTVSLSGSTAFTNTADTCTALQPHKTCSVTVTYAPATIGANDSATLIATTTSKRATATAALTGRTKTASQVLCESYGGTFAVTDLWSCARWNYTDNDDFSAKSSALEEDCFADGGRSYNASGQSGVASSGCSSIP